MAAWRLRSQSVAAAALALALALGRALLLLGGVGAQAEDYDYADEAKDEGYSYAYLYDYEAYVAAQELMDDLSYLAQFGLVNYEELLSAEDLYDEQVYESLAVLCQPRLLVFQQVCAVELAEDGQTLTVDPQMLCGTVQGGPLDEAVLQSAECHAWLTEADGSGSDESNITIGGMEVQNPNLVCTQLMIPDIQDLVTPFSCSCLLPCLGELQEYDQQQQGDADQKEVVCTAACHDAILDPKCCYKELSDHFPDLDEGSSSVVQVVGEECEPGNYLESLDVSSPAGDAIAVDTQETLYLAYDVLIVAAQSDTCPEIGNATNVETELPDGTDADLVDKYDTTVNCTDSPAVLAAKQGWEKAAVSFTTNCFSATDEVDLLQEVESFHRAIFGVHGVNTTTAYPFEEFCQLSQECVRDLIEYGQGQFFYYQTLNKCIYVDACEGDDCFATAEKASQVADLFAQQSMALALAPDETVAHLNTLVEYAGVYDIKEEEYIYSQLGNEGFDCRPFKTHDNQADDTAAVLSCSLPPWFLAAIAVAQAPPDNTTAVAQLQETMCLKSDQYYPYKQTCLDSTIPLEYYIQLGVLFEADENFTTAETKIELDHCDVVDHMGCCFAKVTQFFEALNGTLGLAQCNSKPGLIIGSKESEPGFSSSATQDNLCDMIAEVEQIVAVRKTANCSGVDSECQYKTLKSAEDEPEEAKNFPVASLVGAVIAVVGFTLAGSFLAFKYGCRPRKKLAQKHVIPSTAIKATTVRRGEVGLRHAEMQPMRPKGDPDSAS